MDALVKDEVSKAIAEAAQGPILAGVNRVFGLLRRAGLMRNQRIEPILIGVHPQNRDGFGISGKDAHELMDSIFELGWDSTQVNAVAIEVDPNTDMDVLEFNKKVTLDSMGLLPEIPAHKLLFASLSASHTNAGLRCIAAQWIGLESSLQGSWSRIPPFSSIGSIRVEFLWTSGQGRARTADLEANG